MTEQLKNKVHFIVGTAETLSLKNRQWHIKMSDSIAQAKNVILAIGATPKQLTHHDLPSIALSNAIDSDKISQHVTQDDTVAVFGASHSAILVLRNLIDKKIKRVINFYQSPLTYAVYFDDWILFDDTGLKGTAAEWPRTHFY